MHWLRPNLSWAIHAWVACLLTILIPPSAAAAGVVVSFYSKEFGASFPHAFVTVEGVLDAGGEPVGASYGFTAKSVTPAILMGSVAGEIVSSSPGYIAKSERHFSMVLTDEEYHRMVATVERWRNFPQPSYNLNRRNCVFFVADLATSLGMKAETPASLMKKPRSYLQSLVRENRTLLERRGARLDE